MPMPRRQPSSAFDPAPSLACFGKKAMLAALKRHAEAGRLPGLVILDCTCGNGQDSLFLVRSLAGLSGGARTPVLALDIQQAALEAAAARCRPCPPTLRFVRHGHEALDEALALYAPGLAPGLAVYNLGFLPGSDRKTITRPESTLASLAQAARLMAAGGLLCVHAYAGHPGGEEELQAVRQYFQNLPLCAWRAAEYSQINKNRNPESLFLAWKMEKPSPADGLCSNTAPGPDKETP